MSPLINIPQWSLHPHLPHFILTALSYKEGRGSASPAFSLGKRRHTEVAEAEEDKSPGLMWVPDVMVERQTKAPYSPGCAPWPRPSSPGPVSAGAAPQPGMERRIRGKTDGRLETPRVDGQLAGGLTDTQKEQMSPVSELTEFHLPRKVQRWAWTGY